MKKTLYYLLLLLIIASCNNNTERTKKMSDTDLTQLFVNIKNKDSIALKKMIDKTNVNSFDTSGVNLLSRAVITGDFNIVKILMDMGANPNLTNKTKMSTTPLMMASGYKSLDIANYLLKNGADVDIQDGNGDPVIHWSAYYGNIPFTKLMLEKGAKTDLKSIHSNGVMQVALKEYQDSIVDLLIDYKISIFKVDPKNIAILDAVKQNNINAVKSLLNENNLNSRDDAGNTLLITASSKGYSDIVKYLVDKGALIDALNPVGQTALNKAIYFGNNKIAKYLISKNADINLTDERFVLLPLVAAVRGNNLEMGRLLLKNGADINRIDSINSFSPIMWATAYQNKEFIQLLLQYKPDLTIISKYNATVFDMTKDTGILKLLKNRKD